MFVLPFTPTRFAPAPLEDGGGLLERDGHTPLRMHLPPFADDAVSESDKRRCLPGVLFHQLYPLLPPLHLGEFDAGLAQRAAWHSAMHSAGYRPSRVSLDDYHAMVGSRTLFGERVNPLRPVIDVSLSLNDQDVLLHHLTAVSLQYYLIARRAWLELRTDADAPFSELLPPHVFVTLKADDWCYGGSSSPADTPSTDLLADDDDMSRLAELAQRLPFPRFLRQVLAWVHQRHPDAFTGGDVQQRHGKFCDEKLRKNFVQALTCMRFREWHPQNYTARTDATAKVIKFFPRPNAAQMRGASGGVATRVGQLFTHVFFAPDRPVVACDDDDEGTSEERRRHLLWRLLCFFPLVHFDTRVNVHAKREMAMADDSDPESAASSSETTAQRIRAIFPVTSRERWRLYEAFVCLNPVRARYTFFFGEDERAYLYVPNLHLPELQVGGGILPVDEADARHVTPSAFEWMVARGQRLLETAESMAQLLPAPPAESPVAKYERWFSDTASEHSCGWLLLWSYMRLLGNEEMAYAVVHHHHHLGLRDLQQSRQNLVRYLEEDILDREWRLDPDHQSPETIDRVRNLQALVNEWDRCRRLEPPPHFLPHTLHMAWHLLFPPSVIGLGRDNDAWITHWRTAPPLALLRIRLAEFRSKMQAPQVVQELRACHRTKIADEMRDELRQLAQLMPQESACQHALMDLST